MNFNIYIPNDRQNLFEAFETASGFGWRIHEVPACFRPATSGAGAEEC
jgi:hypothetical protein